MTMKVTVSVIEADTGSIGGHRAPSRQLLDPEGDRVIELAAPEELYDLAALLRDPERYVVESVGRDRGAGRGRRDVARAQHRRHLQGQGRSSGLLTVGRGLGRHLFAVGGRPSASATRSAR
jgi:fructose 1,6-bisphosphatase